jgi:hypothetical protein
MSLLSLSRHRDSNITGGLASRRWGERWDVPFLDLDFMMNKFLLVVSVIMQCQVTILPFPKRNHNESSPRCKCEYCTTEEASLA